MKHPQINTVSEGLRKLIDLFSYGTTHTLKTTYNGPELNDKQMEHLKRLTILTIFEGRQVTQAFNVAGQLEGFIRWIVPPQTWALPNADRHEYQWTDRCSNRRKGRNMSDIVGSPSRNQELESRFCPYCLYQTWYDVNIHCNSERIKIRRWFVSWIQ